jgi:hypothetical protein
MHGRRVDQQNHLVTNTHNKGAQGFVFSPNLERHPRGCDIFMLLAFSVNRCSYIKSIKGVRTSVSSKGCTLRDWRGKFTRFYHSYMVGNLPVFHSEFFWLERLHASHAARLTKDLCRTQGCCGIRNIMESEFSARASLLDRVPCKCPRAGIKVINCLLSNLRRQV